MDDRGSLTDPYDDTEMTDEAGNDPYANPRQHSDAGDTDDADPDIDVYEDEADRADHVNADSGGYFDSDSPARQTGGHAHQSQFSEYGHGQGHIRPRTLPEDEPWPGIEDHMSNGENVDPLSTEIDIADEVDEQSNVSSQPSEYPSTQRAWHKDENQRRESSLGEDLDDVEFEIHEDGDVDISDFNTQWG
jgi:hypothetical protein